MKQSLYVIPYPKFFSQHAGVGGHVAHAAGIVKAMTDYGLSLQVVVEETHDIFNVNRVTIDELPCKSAGVFARQLWALRLLSHIKKQVAVQEYEFCYMRYSASFSPWIPRLKKILGNIPLILEVNSLGSQWRSFLKPVDTRALKSVDRVICVSSVLESYVRSLLKSHMQIDIRRVINGVEPDRFDVSPATLGASNMCHVGFAGLLKADYGIEILLAAAKKLRTENVRLHLFGDGPYKTALESLSVGLDNVEFHGPVPFLEMPSYLKGLDIVLYTTAVKHLYQSPTKLFEYMVTGRPIISARTPQTEVILSDSETALLYDVGNVDQLVEAIRRLNSDAVLSERLARKAQEEARIKHSWLSRVQEILT